MKMRTWSSIVERRAVSGTPDRSIPSFVGPAMAAVAAFGLALALAFVCAPYPVEWAEGRVFETARLMLAGSPLYCDIHVLPCADLTYPPAYSAVVAALGRVFGLGFTAGRAVSLAALLWVLLGLYRIARAQSDRWTALAAPAVFLFFTEVSYYAGSLRPDLLSLALVVSALATLLRWPTIRGTVSSALLLLTGLFVKPQAFAAVCAVCIYLAMVDRKRLAAFIAVEYGRIVDYGNVQLTVADTERQNQHVLDDVWISRSPVGNDKSRVQFAVTIQINFLEGFVLESPPTRDKLRRSVSRFGHVKRRALGLLGGHRRTERGNQDCSRQKSSCDCHKAVISDRIKAPRCNNAGPFFKPDSNSG